jgi:hypothetical protein
MAIPWTAALRAAEALLSGTITRRQAADAARQLQTVEERLSALETDDEAARHALSQIADRLQAQAQEIAEQARVTRRLLLLSSVAIAGAVIAIVLALVK